MTVYGGRLSVGDIEVFLGHETFLDVAFLHRNFTQGFMLSGPVSADPDAAVVNVWVDDSAVLEAFEPDPALPPRLSDSESDRLFNEADALIDDGDFLHVEALERGVGLGIWVAR